MVRLRSDHMVLPVASGSIDFLFDCVLLFWVVFVVVVVLDFCCFNRVLFCFRLQRNAKTCLVPLVV